MVVYPNVDFILIEERMGKTDKFRKNILILSDPQL